MLKSHKWLIALFALELVSLILLFILCFGKDAEAVTFTDVETNELSDQTLISLFEENEVTLTPGVYRVDVFLKDEVLGDSGIQIVAKEEGYKRLLSNMVPLYQNDNYIEFNVWALRKSIVHPKVASGDENYNPILYLNIVKTCKGYSALMFLLIHLYFVIDALIILRIKITDKKISSKKQTVFWIMLSSLLLSYFPLLSGYCYLGSEGRFIFFPVFLLKAGLPFYAVYKIYVFLLLLGSLLTSYYCMRVCFKDEAVSMIISIIYLLFPYHLYSIYEKGAMEEGLIYVLIPFVLMPVILIIKKLFIKKSVDIKELWVNGSKYLKALLIGACVLFLLTALFKVNSFAFETRAVYLYYATNSFNVYALWDK